MPPTPEQVAWAAGLFEGEGSCGVHGKWNQPTVQLTTSDLDVLETFVEVVGVGTIYEVKRKNQLGKKKLWSWHTNKASNVVTVLEMLLPYLHSRRKERAEEVIAVALTKRARGIRGITEDQRELLYELGLKERDT